MCRQTVEGFLFRLFYLCPPRLLCMELLWPEGSSGISPGRCLDSGWNSMLITVSETTCPLPPSPPPFVRGRI